jgi:hypothetical protein
MRSKKSSTSSPLPPPKEILEEWPRKRREDLRGVARFKGDIVQAIHIILPPLPWPAPPLPGCPVTVLCLRPPSPTIPHLQGSPPPPTRIPTAGLPSYAPFLHRPKLPSTIVAPLNIPSIIPSPAHKSPTAPILLARRLLSCTTPPAAASRDHHRHITLRPWPKAIGPHMLTNWAM